MMIQIARSTICRTILRRHPSLRRRNPTPPFSSSSITATPTLPASVPPPPPSRPQQYSCSSTQLAERIGRNLRGYCAGGGGEIDYGREVDEINIKFAEAREDIEAALESKETVYFDEEAEMARESVKEVLGLFDGLLARLPEKDKAALQRSMGLKMEQLKAELGQLNH